MPNYDFIFTAVIIIYYSKELQVYCEDPGLEISFNVNENQAQVEQLVFDDPKKKFLDSLFRKTRRDQSSKIISVCNLQFERKLAMCKVILDANYFGFTFHHELSEYDCELETISFKQPHCDKTKSRCWGKRDKPRKKKLFQCPNLEYKDLETDERIVVPLKHYISGSRLPTSYFSYLEENGAIYPQKYAYNVNVEKIDKELGNEHSAIEVTFDDKTRESHFLAIKNITEMGNTYEKFIRTFRNNNVCGLKRAHKISLCRELFRSGFWSSFGLAFEGYDETVCKRRSVFYAVDQYVDSSYGYSMAILKCPPMYRLENAKKVFYLTSDFLSMGLEARSFMIYRRNNLKRTEIRLTSVIYTNKIIFETFKKDEKRIKEFMEPGYIIQLQRKSLVEPVPALLTLNPVNGRLQLIFHQNIVEDGVINYMKLKFIQKPYERFSINFGMNSIFMMKSKQFSKTCHLILRHKQFQFKFHSVKDDFPRKIEDENIRLVLRDAENLPSEKLKMRECSPVNYAFRHYMTSSTEKDGVLVYERYRSREFVTPVALKKGVMMVNFRL